MTNTPSFTIELVDDKHDAQYDSLGDDDNDKTPTPNDAFATLNNYFSLNALYADSDGSSDSFDMRQFQHIREQSLRQTFDSCEVIPALQSVQQKITPYIGTAEKWKPPNYELTPDHGDMLKPKI